MANGRRRTDRKAQGFDLDDRVLMLEEDLDVLTHQIDRRLDGLHACVDRAHQAITDARRESEERDKSRLWWLIGVEATVIVAFIVERLA